MLRQIESVRPPLLARLVLTAACAALLIGAVQPSAELVLSPYRLAFTHLKIGTGSYVAMVDSGSQIPLMISGRLARVARFEGHDTGSRMQGYDHRPLPILAGKLHDVGLAGVIFGSVSAALVGDQVESVSRQVGTSYDAVIGWPLLRRYNVVLDFPHHELRVTMGTIAHGPAAFDVPYEEVRGTLEVRGGVNERPTTFLFDTGSPECNLDAAAFKLPPGEVRRVQVSLAGNVVALNCRGRDLTLNKPDGVDAVLGEDLMSRYTVIFDTVKKHIALLR